MINLIPVSSKHQIKAARQNTILFRYAVLFGLVLLVTLGVFGVGFYITNNEKKIAEADQAEQAAKAQEYAKTRVEAEAFSKDLSSAKNILTNQVSYSQLLIDIANVLPKNTIISSLNLAANSFGTPVTLTGRAKTYNDALKLKDALENSVIFENVSLTNTSTDASSSDATALTTQYPISVGLNATLSKPDNAPTGGSL